MEKLKKTLNALDWALAIGTLIAGLYFLNVWLLISSAISFYMAYKKPVYKVEALIKKYFSRKKTPKNNIDASTSNDAFYKASANSQAKYPDHWTEIYPSLQKTKGINGIFIASNKTVLTQENTHFNSEN